MELQVIFDRVARHLLRQGRPAFAEVPSGGQRCAYRGCGGSMCAVGVLIEDTYYSEDLEGNSVSNPDVTIAVAQSLDQDFLSSDQIALLRRLQNVHDEWEYSAWSCETDLQAMVRLLRSVAVDFELSSLEVRL